MEINVIEQEQVERDYGHCPEEASVKGPDHPAQYTVSHTPAWSGINSTPPRKPRMAGRKESQHESNHHHRQKRRIARRPQQ